MESAINKLFEYFDGMFFEERVEIDGWGKYGAHYQGLMLDSYLSDSILGRAKSFLKKYGLELEEKSGVPQIKNEYKVAEI